MKIFKPFIDGIVKYDCKKCEGDCCRGTIALRLTTRKKRILINHFPFLRYLFLRFLQSQTGRRESELFYFPKYSGCILLDNKNLCSLHKELGYQQKALICRLYPYYTYTSKVRDEYVIIPDVHHCRTLEIVSSKKLKNKNKIKEESKNILKQCKEQIKLKWFLTNINLTKGRLSLEKRIFQESKRYLDKTNYIEFAMRQIQMAYKGVSLEDIEQQVLKIIILWQQFLKIGDINLNNKRLTYELTAITSLLRFCEPEIDEKIYPMMLLALYILMLIYSRITKGKIYIPRYTAMLELAKRLMLLLDNRKTKMKLLSFAGIDKKKKSSLIKNNSIIELAEKLHLSIEERMGFIYSIPNL